MFGREFPPHILGGLGTASYAPTKGMYNNGDRKSPSVIPKPQGDEGRRGFAIIIGANCTPVAWRDVNRDYVEGRIGKVMDPQPYFDLATISTPISNYMRLNDPGMHRIPPADTQTTSSRKSTITRLWPE